MAVAPVITQITTGGGTVEVIYGIDYVSFEALGHPFQFISGGKFEGPEGQSRSRNVVIEFPDYSTAMACYNSPEYQENIKRRTPHSVADLVIIEGYDGPQP